MADFFFKRYYILNTLLCQWRFNVFVRRYRNRRIGDFLKEMHLTEGRNTGFRKILKALERNGSPLPEFITDDEHSFFITRLFIREDFYDENGIENSKSGVENVESGIENDTDIKNKTKSAIYM